MSTPEIVSLGENALIVRLSHLLDAEVNNSARAIADAIESANLHGITDVVPANSSIGIYFNDEAATRDARERIAQIIASLKRHAATQPGKLVEIPVVYDGPDIHAVAATCGLSVDQVIEIHSARYYQVFAIGFAPGFGYLGELDERIAVPRRSEPRTKVAAGSVAIANRQTAVYPFDTPGGWNLIGSTTLRVFDRDRSPAALLEAGDRVRFVSQ